jgi:glycosyltransferase involved in cell wall biosynthesis
MPCRNEAKYIEKSLGSLLKTDYPKDKLEIIVVEGQSTDGTKDVLESIASKNPIVKVLTNPQKATPIALNIGIKVAKGDIIIRTDAHTEYPSDYINKCVDYLNKVDAWCVGGPVYTVPIKNTLIPQIIASLLSCPFGVGGSSFRTKKKEMYVDTVPYGAFRKDIFERIGLYDERLIKNEDNELCSRISKYGGKIFMTPEIKNIYYARSNIKELLINAYSNGKWNAFTQKLCPYAFKWRHFLPGVFFLGVILCSGLAILSLATKPIISLLVASPLVLYFLLAGIFSFKICKQDKINFLCIPLIMSVFFLYHFSYGYGISKGWFWVLTGLWKEKIKPE